MNATTLKRKLKSLQGQLPESHAIRLHRSISWLRMPSLNANNEPL
jgi:hypothetical protein